MVLRHGLITFIWNLLYHAVRTQLAEELCKECGGSGICEHGPHRSKCKEKCGMHL
jgi:hypothetical protein